MFPLVLTVARSLASSMGGATGDGTLVITPSGSIPEQLWIYYTAGTVPEDLSTLPRSIYGTSGTVDLTELFQERGVGKYIFGGYNSFLTDFAGGSLVLLSENPPGSSIATSANCRDSVNLSGSTAVSVPVLQISDPDAELSYLYDVSS